MLGLFGGGCVHAVSAPTWKFVLLIRIFGMTDAFKEPSRVQSLLQSACMRTQSSLSGLSVSVAGVVIAARFWWNGRLTCGMLWMSCCRVCRVLGLRDSTEKTNQCVLSNFGRASYN